MTYAELLHNLQNIPTYHEMPLDEKLKHAELMMHSKDMFISALSLAIAVNAIVANNMRASQSFVVSSPGAAQARVRDEEEVVIGKRRGF